MTLPKAEKKMSAMSWTKLPARFMKDSVWAEIGTDTEELVEAMTKGKAFADLENFFGKADAPKVQKKAKEEKKKGPQTVNLLDSKRSNNVSIMLAQFRISFVDIKIAILELNEDILDAETVEKMIPACPTAEETMKINGYEGDLKLLGKAEQYFREVGQIARLQTRLQTFHYKLVYEDKVKEVTDGITRLNEAVSSICDSPVFKRLLEVVLTFGNFLNQGSFRGNAQGVKITFLNEMKSTKAPNGPIPGYNMLHYLNE